MNNAPCNPVHVARQSVRKIEPCDVNRSIAFPFPLLLSSLPFFDVTRLILSCFPIHSIAVLLDNRSYYFKGFLLVFVWNGIFFCLYSIVKSFWKVRDFMIKTFKANLNNVIWNQLLAQLLFNLLIYVRLTYQLKLL